MNGDCILDNTLDIKKCYNFDPESLQQRKIEAPQRLQIICKYIYTDTSHGLFLWLCQDVFYTAVILQTILENITIFS